MLADPFDPRCFGVRVPDSYSLPTITYHVRTTYTITSNSSGVVELAFMPNPMLSFIIGQGTATGVTPFTANTGVAYVAAPSSMFPQLLSYRVVGWGAKLIAKDTAFAEKGRLYSVVIPNTGTQPAFDTLSQETATNTQIISEYLIGYQLGTATPSVLQNYATCQSFSLQDLLAYGSMVNSISPSHSDQFRFRGTADPSSLSPWSATNNVFQEGTNTIAGTQITSSGMIDATNLSGTNTLILYASGLPASSNEFDVDIIMHIEGTPNLNYNTSPFVPSGMDAAPGSTTTLETVLARAKPITDVFRAGVRLAMNNLGTTAVQFGANMAIRGMAHGRGRGNRYISGPSGPG
jgi:hypothetical protein